MSNAFRSFSARVGGGGRSPSWRRLRSVVVAAVVLFVVTTTAVGANASTSGWVDQPVTFRSGTMTIYATFRHPVNDHASVPAVLLIARSGPTDRNGNSAVEPGAVNNLKTLADWLISDGVASLRSDKLGSGQTGLGTYSSNINGIGIGPFEQEMAALNYLAAQKGVDDRRLGVFGQSEGALFALLLAIGHAGHVPPIPALGILEPLSLRYLDLIEVQVEAQVAAQVKSSAITKKLATAVNDELVRAVAQLRTKGTVAANLSYGLDSVLNPSTALFLSQADRFDPEALAASLPKHTPVLITCSNDDVQVSCPQVE